MLLGMDAETWTAVLTGAAAAVSLGATIAAWRAAAASRDQVTASLRPQLAPLAGSHLLADEEVFRAYGEATNVGPEIWFRNLGPGTAKVTGAHLRWRPDGGEAENRPAWTSIAGAASVPVVPAGSEGSVLFLFTSGQAANTQAPLVRPDLQVQIGLTYTDVEDRARHRIRMSLRSTTRYVEGRRFLEVLTADVNAPHPEGDRQLPTKWVG